MNFEADVRELYSKAVELRSLQMDRGDHETGLEYLRWASAQLIKLLTEQCDVLMEQAVRRAGEET